MFSFTGKVKPSYNQTCSVNRPEDWIVCGDNTDGRIGAPGSIKDVCLMILKFLQYKVLKNI